MISDPKIYRIGRNHDKWTAAEANHINTVLKTMFKIVIYRKFNIFSQRKLTCRNHEKWTAAEANHLNTVFKTVFKIVIFRKILDADPTKITKMRRKIYCIEAVDENRRFLASERFGSLYWDNSRQTSKNERVTQVASKLLNKQTKQTN